MEPRMRPRPKGQQFSTDDLAALLLAYGDYDADPLPATISCLDSMITDFIIELCHEASARATYAGRAKVKQDDFQFIMRKDGMKLGRVQELAHKEKELKAKRKIFDSEGEVGATLVGEGEGGSDFEGPRKGVGRGRGRRKKRKTEEVKTEDADAGGGEGKAGSGKGLAGDDDGDGDLFGDED